MPSSPDESVRLASSPARRLRARVRSRDPVIGTFVKTASPQTVEILGASGLDFIVLDAEHAPFDLGSLDRCVGAARAVGLPALVRSPDHGAAFINSCLDLGACGVLAPHTRSPAEARLLADAVRYDRGKRGFSPSGRAGGYGRIPAAAYRAAADAENALWCQIEDAEALERIDDIAALEEIDCLFIGPADLAWSIGCSGPDDPRLRDAIVAVAEAGRRHGRAVGLFVPDTRAIPAMLHIGISLFVCGSDQGLLLANARAAASALAPLREADETRA